MSSNTKIERFKPYYELIDLEGMGPYDIPEEAKKNIQYFLNHKLEEDEFVFLNDIYQSTGNIVFITGKNPGSAFVAIGEFDMYEVSYHLDEYDLNHKVSKENFEEALLMSGIESSTDFVKFSSNDLFDEEKLPIDKELHYFFKAFLES